MGLFDTILSPIAGIAGSIIGNSTNVSNVESTNAMQEQLAQNQQNFQEKMSDTAHQREVTDLKAAGLNPILSAGGSGSSTPSGSMATLQAPQIQMPDLMSYGVSIKQLEQADQKISIDKANSAASIAKNLSDVDLQKMQKLLMKQGMLGTTLGTDKAGQFQQVLKSLIDSVKKPNSPSTNIGGPQ